ncbi:hypothetical protein [Methanimicrococcus hacksteinii]|uniref:hypothetical protein n=1 Tax=Methanimicrococcus hacksteinii TaxID=3028293 RepID=UPI00298EF0E2|nr:hypothetical protein [Methanimicrococcus sp. At1]
MLPFAYVLPFACMPVCICICICFFEQPFAFANGAAAAVCCACRLRCRLPRASRINFKNKLRSGPVF